MKTWIPMLAAFTLFACSKDKPKPKPEEPLEEIGEIVDDKPKPKPTAGPIDAGITDDVVGEKSSLRGFSVANGILWSLTMPEVGAAEAKVGRDKVSKVGDVVWCAADPAGAVVWLHASAGLLAFDPATKKLHTVSKHVDEAFSGVVIDYGGEAQSYQSVSGLDTDAAVKLTVGPEPKVEGVVLCEGDRLEYCYKSMKGDDKSKWKLSEDAAAAKAKVDKAKLDDGSIAVLASKRAASYSAPAGAKERKPPVIKLDQSRCKAEPEDCGLATYVGGRFWLVTTDNDRGDFFHEIQQLYDERSKEFVNPEGWLRSRKPHEDSGSVSAEPSPDGHFAFVNGSLIDLNTGKYLWGRGDVTSCGWLDPSLQKKN